MTYPFIPAPSRRTSRTLKTARRAALFALTLAAFAPAGVHATSYTYIGATGGNWDGTGNWTPTGYPNAIGDGALFTTAVTVVQDVAGGVTVGTLSSSANITLTNTNGIIMNQDGTGSGTATISNTGSGAAIRLLINTGTLTLNDDTVVSNLDTTNTLLSTSSTGSLKINSALAGAGSLTTSNVLNDLTYGGILFSTAASGYTGTVTVAKGATFFGNVTAFGSGGINLGVAGSGNGSSLLSVGSYAPTNTITVANSGAVNLLGAVTTNTSASSVTTYGGAVTLNGDLTITSQNTSASYVGISGAISGSRNLNINGTFTSGGVSTTTAGNVRISGSNTGFTGNVNVNAGTLLLGSTTALNSNNTVAISSGATFDLNNNNDTIAGLTGAGIASNGSATLKTLTLGGSGTYSFSGSLTPTTAANLALTVALGAGGVQTLTGTNSSYTGTTTVNSGTLSVGSVANASTNSSLGAGTALATVNGGTLQYTGASATTDRTLTSGTVGGTLEVTSAGTNLEIDGVVTGSNSSTLTKTGAGTLTFGGTGTNATLSLTASAGTVVLAKTGTTAIRGTTGVIINGGATVQLGGTGGNQILDSGGTGGVTANNGTFDVNTRSETVNNLQIGDGTNSGVITGTTGVLTVGAAGTSSLGYIDARSGSASAILDGTVGLNKTTNGTVTLTGANTFTGKTLVSAGTLTLATTTAINKAIPSTGATGAGADAATQAAASDIQITTGGTILYGASNQIANASKLGLSGGTFNTAGFSEGTHATAGIGALTLSTNSVIDLGSGASTLHFASSSGQIWSGTLSIYNYSGSTAGSGTDQLIFGTDTTSLTATQLSEISFYSDSGATLLGTGAFSAAGDGEVVPLAVPEPATCLAGLLLAGVTGMSLRRRRHGAVRAVQA